MEELPQYCINLSDALQIPTKQVCISLRLPLLVWDISRVNIPLNYQRIPDQGDRFISMTRLTLMPLCDQTPQPAWAWLRTGEKKRKKEKKNCPFRKSKSRHTELLSPWVVLQHQATCSTERNSQSVPKRNALLIVCSLLVLRQIKTLKIASMDVFTVSGYKEWRRRNVIVPAITCLRCRGVCWRIEAALTVRGGAGVGVRRCFGQHKSDMDVDTGGCRLQNRSFISTLGGGHVNIGWHCSWI
jgi:hypothetical protein